MDNTSQSLQLVENKASPELTQELLKGLKLSGFEDPDTRRLLEAQHLLRKSKLSSLRPLLPLILNIKGSPYTLEHHFPFEPFFRTDMPRKSLLISGRQVSKSTSQAAKGLVTSLCIPWFSTLCIAPQFEMIRRYSQNYVRPFIDNSPMKHLFMGQNTVNSVLQRTFVNNSQMLFSFAFLTADRTRGISSDFNQYDEVQDIDKDFLPIIRETMSGSKYGGIESYSGTPKSLENTIAGLWNDSSQAEWVIKCHVCGYYNVPALSHDLNNMIGVYRDDISEQKPGVICAKCQRPINPRSGRWVHAYPERRQTFIGRHIPQIIMPMHYADPEKWSALLGKREGKGNTPVNVFYNEVCGESYDTGSRLVTLTELKQAADLPWPRSLDESLKHLDEYTHRVIACDWGGGGEEEISFTAIAVLGITGQGEIHVLWGYRSLTPHDHVREARMVLNAMQLFKCHVLTHDYTGAGSLRETFINQAGIPTDRIIPIAYVRAAAAAKVMNYKPATKLNPRPYYQVDKTRSLLLTCNQIKNRGLRFFKFDYEDSENTGMIYDFLGLVDEKVDSRIGKDVYTITRDPNMRDDFAQAVNIGCCTLWHMTDKWPNIAVVAAMRVDPAFYRQVEPSDKDFKFAMS